MTMEEIVRMVWMKRMVSMMRMVIMCWMQTRMGVVDSMRMRVMKVMSLILGWFRFLMTDEMVMDTLEQLINKPIQLINKPRQLISKPRQLINLLQVILAVVV
jgi:hypothetical protein